RRTREVSQRQRSPALPAHEHQLRIIPAVADHAAQQATAPLSNRQTRAGGFHGMDAAIRSFLTHLTLERRASPHTVRSYGQDLHQFLDFIRRSQNQKTPTPTAVDPFLVRSFLAFRT